MSGRENGQKRRKRRKTRAERNMSRSLVNISQEQKPKSSKKEQQPNVGTVNPSITYAMRSGKGASMFVPSNYKAVTSGTITQSRITTTQRMFTNAKSSDWIKRGPIPETESMKKKVESDLQRILTFAEANRGSEFVNLTGLSDATEGHKGHDSDNGAEVMDMEVCATAQSSQTRINNEKTDTASEKSHQHRESCPTAKDVYTTSTAATAKSKSVGMKKQSSTAGSAGNRKQSSTAGSGGNKTQTSAVGINAQISGRTIRSSCESALLSPLEDEEYLEPEVPVRAAAEKLLRELKTKITLMFPNRDIQKEISYDLHKLVKQRSSNVASNDIETAIPFTDTLLFTVGDCCSQPKSMVNSTLSAFRSTVRDCSKTNMTGPSLRLADTVHPHLSERNSTQLSREKNYGFSSREDQDSFNACLWAPSVVMKDCASAEPIIRINTTSSNRSSDSSEDEDELGGLTAARCDAFIAESRDLERQQHEKRQKQWQAEHDFKLISTNSPSRTVFNDLDSTWIGRQSSKQQSISKLCNCKNSHVHSLNEKSRPPDYNQHVLNSTSNNQTSFSWMDVSPCVADKLPALSFVSSSNRQSSSAALAGSAASWEASTWQQSKSGLSSHSSSAIPRQNLVHQLPLERHASFDSNSATNGLLLLKQDTHDHRFVGGYDKPGYRSFHSLNHPSSRSEGNRFSLSCGRKHRTFPAFGSSCDCFPNIPVMPQCQRATSISTWNNSNDLGSQIIQSRQNFQSALHSACKDSGLDVSLKESGEAMDQDDIFLVRQSEAGSPWINYGGVHTHQVDMQVAGEAGTRGYTEYTYDKPAYGYLKA